MTYEGYLLVSRDSGQTWNAQEYFLDEHLLDMRFVNNSDTGILLTTRNIKLSTDRGISWINVQKIEQGVFAGVPQIIYFKSGDTIIAPGFNGVIWKSNNRGETWNKVADIDYNHRDEDFRSIHFFHPDTGYVWGRLGVYARTTDGGETWGFNTRLDDYSIKCTYFWNNLEGIAGTAQGNIIKTTDGGKSWRWDTSFSSNTFKAFYFFNSDTGVGLTYTNIVKTYDKGKSWRQIDPNPGYELNHLLFKGQRGVIVGDNGETFISNNAGESWQPQFYGFSSFKDIDFTSPDTGYVVINGGRIMKTGDGGATWTFRKVGEDNISVVQFINDSTGFVGGDDYIYKTTDYGDNWKAVPVDFSVSGDDFIQFTSPDTGYAGSDYHGNLLKTIDGGESWEAIYGDNIGLDWVESIYFATNDYGIAGGLHGKMSKTIDGGESWDTLNCGSFSKIINIKARDEEILAITWHGDIRKSHDGGNSWDSIINYINSNNFTEVEFLDSVHGLILKSDTILLTSDFGDSWMIFKQDFVVNNLDFPVYHIGYGIGYGANISKIHWPQPIELDSISQDTVARGEELEVFYRLTESFDPNNQLQVFLVPINSTPETGTLLASHSSNSDGSISVSIPSETAEGRYYLYTLSTSPVRSSSRSDTLEVAGTLSADNLGRENTQAEVQVYPNPATDHLEIKTRSTIDRLTLCNSQGVVIWSEKQNTRHRILNLRHLSPGLYLIKIHQEQGAVLTESIIINP